MVHLNKNRPYTATYHKGEGVQLKAAGKTTENIADIVLPPSIKMLSILFLLSITIRNINFDD